MFTVQAFSYLQQWRSVEKIKITAKFRASRRLRFEDTKRIMSPEVRPKRFGTFEKRAPGLTGDTINKENLGWRACTATAQRVHLQEKEGWVIEL